MDAMPGADGTAGTDDPPPPHALKRPAVKITAAAEPVFRKQKPPNEENFIEISQTVRHLG
ncbi:MAG: hypothetical protein NVSMB31_05660 [Vulcanimicrobiaceae bacterium]